MHVQNDACVYVYVTQIQYMYKRNYYVSKVSNCRTTISYIFDILIF